MRSYGRSIALVITIGVFAWSCSKSLAPKPTVDGGPREPETTWTGHGVREPQTARARLRFVGPIVTLDASGSAHVQQNAVFLIDMDEFIGGGAVPPDTVPALARLEQVRWRVTGAAGNTYVVDPHPVYASLLSSGPPMEGEFHPGLALIRLQVPERAGGGSFTAVFDVNFAPDWWWAGPDPSRFPPSSDGDGRAVDVTDWRTFTTAPAWPPDGRGFFGPDSFATLFTQRPPVDRDLDKRTFYEIWGDRIYARAEGDVVHQGAWVVFTVGGFDRDSPYHPPVNGPAPTLPAGYDTQPVRYPLLTTEGLAGSPIGFRLRIPVRDASGGLLQPSETTTFPDFNASSVIYSPNVSGYWRVDYPGKAYVEVYAVDSHGLVAERTLESLPSIADRVDAGGGTPRDRQLRRRVLTFFVRPADAVPMRATAARGWTRPPGSY